MPPGFGHTANTTAGPGARRTGNSGVGVEMLATVMPMALSKKELTKGVLSGNSMLQVGASAKVWFVKRGVMVFVRKCLCGSLSCLRLENPFDR